MQYRLEANEAKEYILQKKYEVTEENDSIRRLFDVKHFHNPILSEVTSSSERISISDGQHICEFDSDGISVDGEEIPYDSVLEVSENNEKYPTINNYLRIIYSDEMPDATNSLYIFEELIQNSSNGPPTGSFEKFTDKVLANTNLEENSQNFPKYIMNDWIGPNPELRVEGWERGSKVSGSIGGDMKTSGEIEGKSRGYQVGVITGSKTKSEVSTTTSVNANINAKISDGTYTCEIRTIRLYDDRIYIHADPIINVEYSDIEQVMERKSGFTIEINNNTYNIEGTEDCLNMDGLRFLREEVNKRKPKGKEGPSSRNISEEIRELKSLYDDGILTDEEFQSKKKELLDDF